MDVYEPTKSEIYYSKIMGKIIRPIYYKKFVKNMNLSGKEKVLVYGSGTGCESIYICANMKAKGLLTCVDVSKTWMDMLKENLGKKHNIEYKLGHIWDIDIKENFYDLIIIHFVLHDIEKDIRIRCIKTLKDKLKKKGKILIREPISETHGMPMKEVLDIMTEAHLKKIKLVEDKYIFLGKILDGIFEK